MKGILAVAAAATTIGIAAPVNAFPGDPLDHVYTTMLSMHGITVPDNMVEASGQLGREICAMAATGAPLYDIDMVVRGHYNNLTPDQVQTVELSAGKVYCPPTRQGTVQ